MISHTNIKLLEVHPEVTKSVLQVENRNAVRSCLSSAAQKTLPYGKVPLPVYGMSNLLLIRDCVEELQEI